MPCESCAAQFSVFRRRRACGECERGYCAACLRRGAGVCTPCRLLSARPLARHNITHLRARDLQAFLLRHNVSTRGIVEKEELVSLCVSHVNSTSFKRRARLVPPGFCSLKGLTTNINQFISSAFDLRPPRESWETSAPPPRARPQRAPFSPQSCPPTAPRPFTGESYPGPQPVPQQESQSSLHIDTDDCFEVEDLEDSGWEFVTRPADPLPTDSEELLREELLREEASAQAAQEPAPVHCPAPEEPPPPRAATPPPPVAREPSPPPAPPAPAPPQSDDEPPRLEDLPSEEAVRALSVKQLKRLLALNRVEFRGCVEREELQERAAALRAEHARWVGRDLPLEDLCKLCMEAPLECVLLECGHMATCLRCGTRLNECPICRRYVVRAVRVFKP